MLQLVFLQPSHRVLTTINYQQQAHASIWAPPPPEHVFEMQIVSVSLFVHFFLSAPLTKDLLLLFKLVHGSTKQTASPARTLRGFIQTT